MIILCTFHDWSEWIWTVPNVLIWSQNSDSYGGYKFWIIFWFLGYLSGNGGSNLFGFHDVVGIWFKKNVMNEINGKTFCKAMATQFIHDVIESHESKTTKEFMMKNLFIFDYYLYKWLQIFFVIRLIRLWNEYFEIVQDNADE